MAGWFPGGERDHSRYKEAARCHAPNVPVHFLDGKNPDVVRCCWGSRLFLLVDNPQETFGLAPVAMAAGLLAVARLGRHRHTVNDGVEGIRVPTWLLPMLGKEELALQHDHGLCTYQDYVGGR